MSVSKRKNHETSDEQVKKVKKELENNKASLENEAELLKSRFSTLRKNLESEMNPKEVEYKEY